MEIPSVWERFSKFPKCLTLLTHFIKCLKDEELASKKC